MERKTLEQNIERYLAVRNIKHVMNDEIIEEPRKLLSEYQFTLRGLSKMITIRLYEYIKTGKVGFEQSHYMHTPVQAGPYITDVTGGDDETNVIQRAVTTLTRFYNDAVREGHKPDDSWLKINENF
jgi:hypothetical protein